MHFTPLTKVIKFNFFFLLYNACLRDPVLNTETNNAS